MLDIKNIFFTVLGYQMSYLEFWTTITGGVASWLSVKEHISSWIMGLVSNMLAFLLFYQIQLYPDMFLQIFFFITNIIGFYSWKFPKIGEANLRNELRITELKQNNRWTILTIGLAATGLLGTFSNHLHIWFPNIFNLPSTFPYIDSFTSIMSVIATFLLIKKKVEAWWTWGLVDVISTYMYYVKDVKFFSLLYAIFVIVALVGAIEWTKKYQASLAST